MQFPVPQFVDVEDKVAGPLTWKQLLWMIALGITLLILWKVLKGIAFWIIGIPLALFVLAAAFYKPQGVPFLQFVNFGILFLVRPRVYTWKRDPLIVKKPERKEEKKEKVAYTLPETREIQELARILDNPDMLIEKGKTFPEQFRSQHREKTKKMVQ